MDTIGKSAMMWVDLIDLPDGQYHGFWSGYAVQVDIDDKLFEIKTNDGVRSIVPCVITIDSGHVSITEKR